MACDLADNRGQNWEVEPIPDVDYLFMRVHKQYINKDNSLKPSAFKGKPEDDPNVGISTNWCKYASPDDTRNQAKIPTDNIVVRLKVDRVRKIPLQRIISVIHAPDRERNNRAHTHIFDANNVEARLELINIYEHVILSREETS